MRLCYPRSRITNMAAVDYTALLRAAQESDHVFDDCNADGDWLDPDSHFREVLLPVTDTQHEVIAYPHRMDEFLRVRAGPGSGKTYTMTARIAGLLQSGVSPKEILVLSLANRSVDALRASLGAMVGDATAAAVDISTFHSFCGGLLDQYGEAHDMNAAKGRIFDARSWDLLTKLFASKTVRINDVALKGRITSRQLSDLLSAVARGQSVEAATSRYGVNADYVSALKLYLERCGLMRYEDLISRSLELMLLTRNNYLASADASTDQLLGRVAGYRAVFVDEFQDVYPLLTRVVTQVVTYPTVGAAGCKHLTVAGDPNQNIYEFLGTRHNGMENFHLELPGMKVKDIFMRESFRCTQPMLDAAVSSCLDETTKPRYSLRSERTDAANVRPVLMPFSDAGSERMFVADEISRLLCLLGGLVQPRDIAVLARTNNEVEALQKVLQERHGLASRKIAQGNVWLKSNLHLLRDVLSVVSGEGDASFSLLTVLQRLDTAIGSSRRTSRVLNESQGQHSSMFLEDFLFRELVKVQHGERSMLQSVYKTQPDVLERIAQFLNSVQHERENLHASPEGGSPAEIVDSLTRLCEMAPIRDYLAAGHAASSSRLLLEAFNCSLHYSYDKFRASNETTESFLNYFLKTCDNEVPPTNGNVIQVSTIHSAKGLEFPVVFVLGSPITFISPWNAILASGSTDKARNPNSRLLYVALTRARDLLYVGCGNPEGGLLEAAKSYFTEDLPDLEVEAAETADGKSSNLEDCFRNLSISSGTLAASLVLLSYARDVKRLLPLARMKSLGSDIFTNFTQANHMHATHKNLGTATPKPSVAGTAFGTPFTSAARGTHTLLRKVRRR